jgi:hypothetical protein
VAVLVVSARFLIAWSAVAYLRRRRAHKLLEPELQVLTPTQYEEREPAMPRIVKGSLARAGIDAKDYSGHSLLRGGAGEC